MAKIKYIRTKHDNIIVFPEIHNHSEFKHFEPKSAGFLWFEINHETNEIDCKCYGESVSLHLKSIPEEDAKLAKAQILGYSYW
ncbi:MAG TPA: hypothetical protein VK172_10215 [Lentimicrobium sp.]|nr:hypothetical protein [Lentimicrobium sp.]